MFLWLKLLFAKLTFPHFNSWNMFQEYNDGVVFMIHGVKKEDAGVYRCTGEDRYGHTTYEDFHLEVEPSMYL